jgi:hypothetical protein
MHGLLRAVFLLKMVVAFNKVLVRAVALKQRTRQIGGLSWWELVLCMMLEA